MDDSGIGSSIRQLKQDGGLPGNETSGQTAKTNVQKCPNNDKDNETEKEKEKEKEELVNQIPVTVSDEESNDTNPKILHATISSQYEDLLDTPPDSLLGHIPVTVLDKAAESFNSLRSNSSKGSSNASVTKATDQNLAETEDENVSDKTLVRSSSDTDKLGVLTPSTSESEKSAKDDEHKPNHLDGRESCNNPPLPVELWTPSKPGCVTRNECHNEGGSLPPHQWTPFKPHCSKQVWSNLKQV